MRYLLDSQRLYAAAFAPNELSQPAQTALSDPRNDCFVSPVSLYELELKKGARQTRLS